MSGTLSTLGLGSFANVLSGAAGGNLVSGELSRLLGTAALGGVTFDIIDSREAAGRRVSRFLFPNRPVEDQKFQDFGTIDQPIRITGYLAGDDYVLRADRMRKVLLKAGRQTLVHPWWGRLKVRVLEPGEIQFSATRLRIAQFQVTLVRDPEPSATGGLLQRITDTLTNLLEQADAIVDDVTLTVQAVLAPLAIPLALSGVVGSFLSQASGVWDALTASAPQPLQTGVLQARAVLAAGVSVPSSNGDTAYADAVTAALAAVPAAAVTAITDPSLSVVAPAQQITGDAAEIVDATTVMALLLSAAVQIGAVADTLSNTSTVPAEALTLGVAARALIVSQMLGAWGGLEFVSGADAVAARDQLIAAIDALKTDLENAASAGSSVSLSGLWGSVQSARMALVADCSSQVGRLPRVVAVPVAATVSGWALAYAVAGDDVSQVQGIFDDLISRNAIGHPALVGPGDIQVLEQST
ncbi:hypothetical protein HKD24_06150 [Gluconobacter sp. LMG 31484]|uniref:DNA circulation N-terminal domain-containing protein n=1 Tax=Gluconobacter vitians TaxID=2728102 RepID=A0ABR9Y5Q2_9PROT|nr:DNA circularization N-terminal domain-containing protein [Gluconobacter vitians]MBF0858794.1 hypothetical protein [Gluconobacter vitians]